MVTIYRNRGFQVIIRTDDHPPPHVHVKKAEGWVQVWIGDEHTPASVKAATKISDRDIVRAVRLVDEHWKTFLARWEKIHVQAKAE